jgi:hypothetical protein
MMKRALLVSLAASLLVGVTACGSSTPSSTVLLKDALSAFDSASSVKVSGVVPHKGGNYDVDLAMSRSGDLSGTISTSIQQIKLIIVGGTAYQYVSKDFFTQLVLLHQVSASLCAVICDKYIKSAPSGQYAPFTMTSMISGLNSTMPKASSSVTLTTFAGQAAYKLTEADGTHAYIAERGKHYLLGVAAKEGELTFTEWNTVPAIMAPPVSQIADYPGAG